MQQITAIGHTDLISNFMGDLRYLTMPAPDAQLTMLGLKALRPAVVLASLCPFDFQNGSDRPLLPSQAWQRWLGFRTAVEASPTFHILDLGMSIDPNEQERIQLVLHLEGANPIEKPADLEQFVAFGGRALTLTWNQNNQYAGGAFDNGRLTLLGKDLLKRIRAQEVLLDISHLNEASFWDVINEDDGPIMASHSNFRELTDSPRNLTRRQLHALRSRPSWVGVSFAKSHLTDRDHSTIEDVVRHLEGLVEELGIDRVGIGTDYGGITSLPPKGLASIDCLLTLWDALRSRGYSDEHLVALRGNNFLRFMNSQSLGDRS